MNIMKLCSTDQELRLINEISWRHAYVSTSPHRRHETSRFKKITPPPHYGDVINEQPLNLYGSKEGSAARSS